MKKIIFFLSIFGVVSYAGAVGKNVPPLLNPTSKHPVMESFCGNGVAVRHKGGTKVVRRDGAGDEQASLLKSSDHSSETITPITFKQAMAETIRKLRHLIGLVKGT